MAGASKLAVYAGIAIAAVVVVSLAVLLFKKEEEDDGLWEIIKDAHTFATPLTDAEIEELWRVADADGSGYISEGELKGMMVRLWEIQIEKIRRIALESAEECRRAMMTANASEKSKSYKQERIDELYQRMRHPAELSEAEAYLEDARSGSGTKKLFKELDIDGDGTISKAEWKAKVNKVLHAVFAKNKILTKSAFKTPSEKNAAVPLSPSSMLFKHMFPDK